MRKTMKIKASLMVLAAASLTLAACNNGNNGNTGSNASAEPSATASTAVSPAASSSAESNTYAENGLPKDEKVTLKFAYWENAFGREWIDYAMQTFKEKFPNVTFETTYSPKIDTIIGTKIAANDDEDMFDIFSNNIPGANVAASLVEAGKLEPLEELWGRIAYDGDGKTLKDLAQPGSYEATSKINGNTYAFPNVQSATGLFYNKSLFEKNGWNQNPQTWSEFVQLTKEIKEDGIIPITFPGMYPIYLNFSFGIAKYFEMAESKGTLATFEPDFRAYKAPFYSTPEVSEAYQRIYELGKLNAFPKGVGALSHTQSQMQLLQGQAALASTGDWVQNEMADAVPEDFRWGFMIPPLTENPDAKKWYYVSNGAENFVWANKPELNKKWAKEFLVWLWNLDIQQRLAEKAGGLPIRADFMNDSGLVDKLQEAPKAVLEYMKKNKVKGDKGLRYVTLSDPNAEQAAKLIDEATIGIALGTQDPLPKLQEADALLQKAVDASK